jgi:hypothetical protein
MLICYLRVLEVLCEDKDMDDTRFGQMEDKDMDDTRFGQLEDKIGGCRGLLNIVIANVSLHNLFWLLVVFKIGMLWQEIGIGSRNLGLKGLVANSFGSIR